MKKKLLFIGMLIPMLLPIVSVKTAHAGTARETAIALYNGASTKEGQVCLMAGAAGTVLMYIAYKLRNPLMGAFNYALGRKKKKPCVVINGQKLPDEVANELEKALKKRKN